MITTTSRLCLDIAPTKLHKTKLQERLSGGSKFRNDNKLAAAAAANADSYFTDTGHWIERTPDEDCECNATSRLEISTLTP